MPCPEKFAEALTRFSVDPVLIADIASGYERLTSKSPKKEKAAYFKRAMDILDAGCDAGTVAALMDWNACCKTGARERASKEFARINAGLPLEEKLAKLRKAPYMNMGAPYLEPDGTLRIDAVAYVYEGKYACACSNYRRVARDYPVSKTYCLCCGGHFRYHYQIMLACQLDYPEVLSSPLDSSGQAPCVFRFKFK